MTSGLSCCPSCSVDRGSEDAVAVRWPQVPGPVRAMLVIVRDVLVQDQQLPGTWVGGGFNLIARPEHIRAFFLQLSATQEIIEFTPIGSPFLIAARSRTTSSSSAFATCSRLAMPSRRGRCTSSRACG